MRLTPQWSALSGPVCRGWLGDWGIVGKLGHILDNGGDGYPLCVVAKGERDHSSRRWTNVKERLSDFCRLTQVGHDEGCCGLTGYQHRGRHYP